ncbi:helix-turn-helix domain-containing protein [Acetobacteraceae bacterium]|nr:helix-turn-helix domain-containing protein [Acetobacteraceae bacterium]
MGGDAGFGQRVTQWRKKSGLSRVDVAKALDIEKSYLQAVEEGRIFPTRLAQLGFEKFFELRRKNQPLQRGIFAQKKIYNKGFK